VTAITSRVRLSRSGAAAATWRIATTTSTPLCQGDDMAECAGSDVSLQPTRPGVNDRHDIQPAATATPDQSRPTFTRRPPSTTPSDRKRGYADDLVTTSPPRSISGSGQPRPVSVASDGQASVIYGGSVEASDFYYDAESAAMERVALVVRHLGLVVGVGACALAVGVVVLLKRDVVVLLLVSVVVYFWLSVSWS